MRDDPIVNEVRRIRQAYAEQFKNDLHAICEDLRRQERESGRKLRRREKSEDEPTTGQAEERAPGE